MQQRFTRYALVPIVVALVIGAACTPGTPTPPTTTTTTTTAPRSTVTRWTDLLDRIRVKLNDPDFVNSLGSTQEERADILTGIVDLLDDPAYQSDEEMTAEQIAGVAEQDVVHDQWVADRQEFQDLLAQSKAEERDAEVATDLGTLGGPLPDKSSVMAEGGDNITPFQPAWVDGIAKQGASDMFRKLVDRIAEVNHKIATNNLANDPLAQDIASHRLPVGSPPPPAPLTGGRCDHRVGDRFAPDPDTRPGTIYTPAQDTFAERTTPGATQYQGELQVRTVTGDDGQPLEQFLVEAHIIDTSVLSAELQEVADFFDLDPAEAAAALADTPDIFKAHLFVMYPGQADELSDEYWASGNGADYEVLCYRNDATKGPGDPVNRAYVRAWLPMDTAERSLGEPGFQIRTAISDYHWFDLLGPFVYFFGSDMHTVHLGPEPLVHFQGADHSLGVTADDSFVVNKDGVADNDIEATLRGVINEGMSSAIGSLDESSWYFLDPGFVNWGWLGATATNVAEPETVTSDISIATTETKGTNTTDDERVVQLDVHADNIDVSGYASTPTAGFGLIPCVFTAKVDIDARTKFGLDIDRGFLSPDFLELEITNVDMHNIFVSPLPVGCNVLYFMNLDGLATGMANLVDLKEKMGDDLAVKIRNAIHAAADIDDVALPNGGGFDVKAQNLEPTCAPYGCNGKHAGDVALIAKGLEAIDDPIVTDLKTWDPLALFSKRRFPVSYQPSPSLSAPIDELITDHLDPDGQPYDLALWASPALLNQFLRAITEGGGTAAKYTRPTGILDIHAGGYHVYPQVAPMYLSDPDHPVSLLVPNLEFSFGDGYYAVNAAAGVDLTYDPATSKLDPATINVSDLAAGVQLIVHECEVVLWFECVVAPSFVPDLVGWLGSTVLTPILDNTIAKIEVPKLVGFEFVAAKIENVDGNLAVYADAG